VKTFLKIALIVLAALLAIKLLPLTLAAGFFLAAVALLILVVGASAAAVLFCVAVILAAALSPIWLPVLAVIGLVSLIRRSRGPASVPRV
jgi:hypothetical protein